MTRYEFFRMYRARDDTGGGQAHEAPEESYRFIIVRSPGDIRLKMPQTPEDLVSAHYTQVIAELVEAGVNEEFCDALVQASDKAYMAIKTNKVIKLQTGEIMEREALEASYKVQVNEIGKGEAKRSPLVAIGLPDQSKALIPNYPRIEHSIHLVPNSFQPLVIEPSINMNVLGASTMVALGDFLLQEAGKLSGQQGVTFPLNGIEVANLLVRSLHPAVEAHRLHKK